MQVTQWCVENSASISGAILTTNVLICEIPKPEAEMGGGGGGGMDGMY